MFIFYQNITSTTYCSIHLVQWMLLLPLLLLVLCQCMKFTFLKHQRVPSIHNNKCKCYCLVVVCVSLYHHHRQVKSTISTPLYLCITTTTISLVSHWWQVNQQNISTHQCPEPCLCQAQCCLSQPCTQKLWQGLVFDALC